MSYPLPVPCQSLFRVRVRVNRRALVMYGSAATAVCMNSSLLKVNTCIVPVLKYIKHDAVMELLRVENPSL